MQATVSNDLRFMSGGGEMGHLMRTKDWSGTALGNPAYWPQRLKTSINIILNSGFPMFLWWGEELTCFYNDAYRPSLGNNGKHPGILGVPAKIAWSEIWEFIDPLINQVMKTGEAVWMEDQLVPIYRNGKIEDVWWTFSYSPINDELYNPVGILVTCVETTAKVNALRKIELSEKKFRDSVKQAPVGITVFRGPEFYVELANETYLQIVDKKEAEFIGRPLFDSLPEVKAAVAPLLTDVYTHGVPHYGNGFPVTLNRYGKTETTYFNFVYQPLIEESGEITGIIVIATEVTESIKTRHALAESEKRFRNMVMQSPIPMAIFRGNEYVIEMANTMMFENIWRKKEADVIGKKALEVFPELNNQKFPALLNQVFTTGKAYHENEAVAYVAGDNGTKKFYLDFEYAPLFETDGTVSGIMITVNDVTEKVEARKKVEENEERLNIIIQASKLGTWELDLQTDDLVCSERFLEIFGAGKNTGISHKEALGQVHPEDLPKRAAAFKESFTTGTLFYEIRLVWRDASIHWVVVRGKVFYDAQNKPLRILGTIQDVTEEKNDERELFESEQKFRLLANSMPQFVWTSNEKGELNYFNQAVYNYSGLSVQDLQTNGWSQIIHPDEREENIREWTNAIATGKDFLFEHRFRRYDGEYRWQLSRAVAQRDATGAIQMWIGTSTDIQEIKEQELQKDYFISMASHELKTPLTTIKGYVQILKSAYEGNEDPMLASSLGIVDKQINTLTKLISDLLDVSKIRAGALVLNNEKFQVKDLINETIRILNRISVTHKIVLVKDCDAYVYADKERIGQVIINFITNAIKYSPGADKITVECSVNANNVIVTVEDFGIGINKVDQERIFERFYRVEGKKETTFPGFGIGLYIASEIIRRHQGTIGVTSEFGKGSVFYFSLPVADN